MPHFKHYSGVRFSLCCVLKRPLIINIMYIITAGFFFVLFFVAQQCVYKEALNPGLNRGLLSQSLKEFTLFVIFLPATFEVKNILLIFF